MSAFALRPRRRLVSACGRALIAVCWTTALAAQERPASGAAPDYDIVIRNGRVLDGAGNPWILADVAIANGRFVRVGRVAGRGAHGNRRAG